MTIKIFAEYLAENPTDGPLSITYNDYLEEIRRNPKPKVEDKAKTKDKPK
jgi:hypothetical protein